MDARTVASALCGQRGRLAALCLLAVAIIFLGAGANALAQDEAQAMNDAPSAVESPDKANEPKTFAEWMEKAQAGDPKAQCNVGVFYVNGKSVPLNIRLGIEWLHRSADQGFSYAQYVLAEIYTSGESDVVADTPEAFFWASVSAAATDLPEKIQRKAAKLRDLNLERLSADEAQEAQQKTAAWWASHPHTP